MPLHISQSLFTIGPSTIKTAERGQEVITDFVIATLSRDDARSASNPIPVSSILWGLWKPSNAILVSNCDLSRSFSNFANCWSRLSEERTRIKLNVIPVIMSVWGIYIWWISPEWILLKKKTPTISDVGNRALLLIALTTKVTTTQVV